MQGVGNLNFDSKSKRKTGNDITIENQYQAVPTTEKCSMSKYRLKLLRHVTLESSHKKAVLDMKSENARKVLVTIGEDHRLCLVDLDEKK